MPLGGRRVIQVTRPRKIQRPKCEVRKANHGVRLGWVVVSGGECPAASTKAGGGKCSMQRVVWAWEKSRGGTYLIEIKPKERGVDFKGKKKEKRERECGSGI